MVVEISDSSLTIDREDKGRIYARANLPQYWIVNLVDEQVGVYGDPTPNGSDPAYGTRTDFKPGDMAPFNLDGQNVAQVLVDELLG